MDKRTSVLLGNVDELYAIKEELIKQTVLRENIQEHTMEKHSLEKDITTEEKLVEDTIESTIKKRREELEEGFDKEINNNIVKLKSVKNKRESTKNKAIKDRIRKETKEIKNENKMLHKEIRDAFKEKKVPRFCDSALFYSLFCTKERIEFFVFAVITIIAVAVIPNIVCYLFNGLWIWKVLIYIGLIIVVFGIYIIIYKLTKARNKEIFELMRPNRIKINNNKKNINKIKKQIKNDTDESIYNLGEFDSEIISTEEVVSNLRGEKEKALKYFEEYTTKAITDEIIERSKDKIKQMRDQSVNLTTMLKEIEAKLQDISLYIATDYEVYLGREFMTVDMIERLIKLIKEEKASTIAEAVGIVKGQI